MISVETSKFRLIWCSKEMKEQEWIRFLFGDLIEEEIFPDIIPPPKAFDIYIVNSNKTSLRTLYDALRNTIGEIRPIGLVHLSDEWFGGGYDVYRNFDFVVRTHHACVFDRNQGILVIPLGWPNGAVADYYPKRASERGNRWCFVGNLIATRHEMAKYFLPWTPNCCHLFNPKKEMGPRLSKQDFDMILRDSTFCPAPMGNVMAETWRFYEALKAGSIPILERRLTIDYYRNLLGNHPIPTFRSWRLAMKFARASVDDGEALDGLQSKILRWWENYERDLVDRVRSFLVHGARGGYRANLSVWRFPTGVSSRIWQVLELTRHHSPMAIVRRVFISSKAPKRLLKRLLT